MTAYKCTACHKTSYSADPKSTLPCPYCLLGEMKKEEPMSGPDNSNYPAGVNAHDLPDWEAQDDDGLRYCPECAGMFANLVKEDEENKDCCDHMDDSDLRKELRKEKDCKWRLVKENGDLGAENEKLKTQIEELGSRLRYKEDLVKDCLKLILREER